MKMYATLQNFKFHGFKKKTNLEQKMAAKCISEDNLNAIFSFVLSPQTILQKVGRDFRNTVYTKIKVWDRHFIMLILINTPTIKPIVMAASK